MEQIKTARMQEVATKLGISASTVSRALRDDPRISLATRAKVRETATALGYQPNPLVSALMANRKRRAGGGEIDVIALITHYGAKEDWRAKDVCRWEFEGIRRRAAELGFKVEVFPLEDFEGDPARLRQILHARGIRGVLLGFSRDSDPAKFNLATDGFAVAGLSAYFRSAPVDRANFHGFFNVQLALDQIYTHGYRRPALVVPEFNNRISNNLWSGAFLDWQRRLAPADRCEPFLPAEHAGAGEFASWLEAQSPDALLIYKVPVRAFLAKKPLAARRDLGLAWLYRTSDEMGLGAGIDGNLSVVGAAALELVVEKLNANNFAVSPHPKEVLIKGTWHDGDSLPRLTPD